MTTQQPEVEPDPGWRGYPGAPRHGRRSRWRSARLPLALLAAVAAVAGVLVGTLGGTSARAAHAGTAAVAKAPAPARNLLLEPLGDLPAPAVVKDHGTGAPASTQYTFTVGGITRYYRLHLPNGRVPDRRTPLVVVLPGWRRTARDAENEYGFDALADAEGFAVVYADGSHNSWDAGTCCGYAAQAQLPDLEALHQVVDEVAAQTPVDRSRVVLAGFSNGGMLAYRAACGEADQLAGIIVDSASLQVSSCTPGPVSIVSGHGARDKTLPVKGVAHSNYLSGPVTSQVATLAPFEAADACTGSTVAHDGRYTVTSLRGCAAGVTVDTYIDNAGGHAWLGVVPGGKTFAAQAWSLLQAQRARASFAR